MELEEDFSEDLDFEESETVCPNCGHYCEGESDCPNCGAILEMDDEFGGFQEEEEY